jgi:hypothetical protein
VVETRQTVLKQDNPPTYEDAQALEPFEQGNGSGYQDPSPIRPFALPQVDYGSGVPFLRGYSANLDAHGLSVEPFLAWVDAMNTAIVPNAEMQIVGKAAGLAGWFV